MSLKEILDSTTKKSTEINLWAFMLSNTQKTSPKIDNPLIVNFSKIYLKEAIAP